MPTSTDQGLHQQIKAYINRSTPASADQGLHQQINASINRTKPTSTDQSLHQQIKAYINRSRPTSTDQGQHQQINASINRSSPTATDQGMAKLEINIGNNSDFNTMTFILNKLEAYGIKGEIHKWVRNFLIGRTQWLIVNGEYSEVASVSFSGIPQGSVSDPYYSSYISTICQRLSKALSNFLLMIPNCTG